LKRIIKIEKGNPKIMLQAMRRPIFLIGFFVLLLNSVKSQDLDVGLTGGGMYYLGDLNPGKHFLNTQVTYGLLVRYNIDTRWSVKLSGTMGSVKGDASQSTFLPDRGLSFSSKVTDIAAVAEFNFLPYFTGSRRNRISPYIYAGFSVFFFNPISGGVQLRDMGTEGQTTPYASFNFSIPFGLGAKFSLASRLGMQVYWEMHKTFTDYLDDVSTIYYLDGPNILAGDQKGMLSDPTRNHAPGMQRGNESNNDWYAMFGISITYKFNLLSSNKCRDLEH
jgi:hypothetical protein